MERWASSGLGDTAVFLSVCVEGPRVAKTFAATYGLRKSACAYLEHGDSPRFPAQLGCQGFVVLDAQGRVLSLRTRAWTEERDAAFDDVERLLRATSTKRAESATGFRVRLAGLARRQDMNGLEGVVVAGGERLSVKLDRDGSVVAAAPENLLRIGPLAPVGHASMDAEHADLVHKIHALYADMSTHNLLDLRRAFAAHADDEEALLRRRDANSAAFSALDSHAADHARILHLADAASDPPSLQDVRLLAAAIYDHADTFDAHYAGTLGDPVH